MAVGDEAQVGEGVLDLGAVEKAQAAVNAVADVVLDQLLFEVARLRIRAVEDRAVARIAALADMFANRFDDVARFVLLVVRRVERDRLARVARGPELFAETLRVVGDDRVRRLEDGAGRAIVLFEADRLRARKIAQEMLHVLHARAAPAVDRLIVVADDEDLAGLAREHANPRVLQRVRVLEFVDQQVAPAFAVMCEQLIVGEEQLVRAQQQLGEIDEARALALFFVSFVNVDERARQWIAFALERGGPLALVLGRVDEPRGLARRKARFVEAECGNRALDQALLVVAVENLERLRQLRLAPMLPQQAMGDAVERADREPARVRQRGLFEQRLRARAHLAGRLVRERDREHRPWRHALDFEQPADAVREHARLAGAGAREYKVVAERRADRFTLRRVQIVE